MKTSLIKAAVAATFAIGALGAQAQERPTTIGTQSPYWNWNNQDVLNAHKAGQTGAGISIGIVAKNGSKSYGSLSGPTYFGANNMIWLSDAEWAQAVISRETIGANIVRYDSNFNFGTDSRRFNASGNAVILISDGVYVNEGWKKFVNFFGTSNNNILRSHDPFIQSAVNNSDGRAVVIKAAGDHWGKAVNANLGGAAGGAVDIANVVLAEKGKASAIFVGALKNHSSISANGTVLQQAEIANYSARPGNDKTIQNKFVVVGVNTSDMAQATTKIAAAEAAGYAAIVSAKFAPKGATNQQVVNRLLSTARTDTIVNYNPAVHGKGELSLSRALNATSIK